MAYVQERKNKNGEVISYSIRVHKGEDNTGKQLKPYTTTFKPDPNMTKKQVEKALNAFVVQFEQACSNGLTGDFTKVTLAEFCPQYLEIKKNSISPLTYDFYRNTIRNRIIPLLGHLKLNKIKPAHVQQFVQVLSGDNIKESRNGELCYSGEKLKPATVRRYLTILQSIFKQAMKLELISSNPASADNLTLQKVVAPKVEIFTKQEAAEMLSFLEQESLQFQVLIQLAIMTGARRGELIGLKFNDIDYEKNKITIERAAIKRKGHPIELKPPKDYEIRTVTISPYCIELVKMLYKEKHFEAERLGSEWCPSDWVFTKWNGEIMNPQTPTKQFSKFLKRNRLTHRKFHSLRHTSATLLLYGGVNIKQVQERLGHGDITTTNKYLHYIAEADEQAANILQDMLITKTDTKLKEAK